MNAVVVPLEDRAQIRTWLLAGVVTASVVLLLFCRRAIRRSLRRDLNRAGMPTCVHCGYDLSAGEGERCPECGTLRHA